jgi:hypothetical protein
MHKRTGLTLFGVLWILVGLFTLGMSFLIAVTATMGPKTAGGPPAKMMVPAALMYLGVGACFITLGIGSIMAKRWARSLILSLSWMWLIIGVLTAFSMFFVMPKMFEAIPPDQAAAKPVIMGCTTVMVFVFFILLPGGAILFYRSPSVKAAVEALDPVPRWSDQPIPLLTFAVWMIGGGAIMAIFSFMYTSFPLGPWVLRGASVYALMFAFCALMLFVGFGALKRKPAAWWAAIGMFVLGIGFAALFVTKTDFAAWYQEMGVAGDARQAEVMQEMYTGPFFIGWLIVFWAGYLAFLLYLRRYFFLKEVTP